MLKRLRYCVVAVALLFPIGPHKACAQQKQEAQQNPTTAITVTSNGAPQTQADHPAQKAPETHAGIEWSNWVLVAVGLLTFLAVWMQVKESAKATKAMRDSIRLQEAGVQQWIEVGYWKSEGQDTARGKGVQITAEITNPTSFPLMISNVVIRMECRTHRLGTSTWIRGDYYLLPKNPLTATFHFRFTDTGQDQEFQNRRLHFDIEGSLSYVDALKNQKTQMLEGVLTCSPKRTYLTPGPRAMEPKNSDQYPN
jgi:hypothetical protein